MRQANRSHRCPTRVRSLFVEPLEDRFVLSSVSPASISPSAFANQSEEIVSIVPIDAQRDADESKSTSNDATPDDDYVEPMTPSSDTAAVAANHSSDVPDESVGTVDDTPESPGQEVYPRNRDASSSSPATQMDATLKYETSQYVPSSYERPLVANPTIAQQVVAVSSPSNRQPLHSPTIPIATVTPLPLEATTPVSTRIQASSASIAAPHLSADELDRSEQSQADQPLETPESLPNSIVTQRMAMLESPVVVEPPTTEFAPRNLLAGTFSLDLQALRQAANEALARLDSLGDQLVTATESWNLFHCLVVATCTAGAVEFVRTYRKRAEPSGTRETVGLVEPCWEPLLVLAVRWPDGEP